jgi:hypothetical protein
MFDGDARNFRRLRRAGTEEPRHFRLYVPHPGVPIAPEIPVAHLAHRESLRPLMVVPAPGEDPGEEVCLGSKVCLKEPQCCEIFDRFCLGCREIKKDHEGT